MPIGVMDETTTAELGRLPQGQQGGENLFYLLVQTEPVCPLLPCQKKDIFSLSC